MRKIVLLLVLACLPLLIRAQQSSFLQEMSSRLENSKSYTLQLASLMPQEGYHFKPVADEMDFAEQLLHMAGNRTWLTSTYLTAEPNIFSKEMLLRKGKNKKAVASLVSQAFDYAIQAVKNFDERQLEEAVKFGAGPLSKRQIMMLINDHQTHHRGQIIVYLRLKHIQPPNYVGW